MAERDATPAAAELAEENNLDLSIVKGTGADGRITKGDVEAALEGTETVDKRAISTKLAAEGHHLAGAVEQLEARVKDLEEKLQRVKGLTKHNAHVQRLLR